MWWVLIDLQLDHVLRWRVIIEQCATSWRTCYKHIDLLVFLCILGHFSQLYLAHRFISTGCPVCLVLKQGAVNQIFLEVFLMFLACLDHKWWAQFHLGILGQHGWKKSTEILSTKKGQISGLAQSDIFSDFLVLGVANFRINYLRQFSFNFENSCAHLAANFLNFSKHTQLFTFGWFWRKLWTNNQKNWKSEKCQFEQILKSDLFSG